MASGENPSTAVELAALRHVLVKTVCREIWNLVTSGSRGLIRPKYQQALIFLFLLWVLQKRINRFPVYWSYLRHLISQTDLHEDSVIYFEVRFNFSRVIGHSAHCHTSFVCKAGNTSNLLTPRIKLHHTLHLFLPKVCILWNRHSKPHRGNGIKVKYVFVFVLSGEEWKRGTIIWVNTKCNKVTLYNE